MVSQHILSFLFNLFDLFNYRHLKINGDFFPAMVKRLTAVARRLVGSRL